MAFSIFFFSLIISYLSPTYSQSFIGVNYGLLADNLPPPSDTAKLLQSTSIQKVRLYGADPTIIKSLADTNVEIVIGVANGDIPSLATDVNVASQWINSNVIPFYPSSKIILINVGNEIMLSNDPNLVNQLLPAMQNVQKALEAVSLGGKIKVSTVHAMTVLGQSEPPSAGSFAPAYRTGLKGILQFLSETGSPFVINPYPFFAYLSDPRPETLSFCLFQTNPGRVDSNTGIKYMNMFDAQVAEGNDKVMCTTGHDVPVCVDGRIPKNCSTPCRLEFVDDEEFDLEPMFDDTFLKRVDAVHSALKSMGFEKVEVVVAETGWPTSGDSDVVGPSVENAKAYNGNLIAHLKSMVGTPLMPSKSIDTYIFALFDENLKPGPSFERSFGLYKPDLSIAYDIGLAKTTSSSSQISQSPQLGKATTSMGWCVPKEDATQEQLQSSLDWVCGHDGIDCSPIMQGGVCFEPNNLASHAAYAMNLYFQKSPENPTDCDFSQTAKIISDNPSYNNCIYPRTKVGEDISIREVMNKYVSSDKVTEKNRSECFLSSSLPLSLFFIFIYFLF